jgi:hypothetical protein
VAQGYAAGAQAAGVTLPGGEKMMVFGGRGHKVYLGCLTCSKYDTESVLNAYGDFGSAYSTSSVHNKYGDYGSKYGDSSACNPYASDPPVIVDDKGRYYGRLTVSTARTDGPPTPELRGWIRGLCGA